MVMEQIAIGIAVGFVVATSYEMMRNALRANATAINDLRENLQRHKAVFDLHAQTVANQALKQAKHADAIANQVSSHNRDLDQVAQKLSITRHKGKAT